MPKKSTWADVGLPLRRAGELGSGKVLGLPNRPVFAMARRSRRHRRLSVESDDAPTIKNEAGNGFRPRVVLPGALDRIRTCGFLLRRQTLYPLSYKGTVEEIIRYHGRNGKTKTRFGRIHGRNHNDRADGLRQRGGRPPGERQGRVRGRRRARRRGRAGDRRGQADVRPRAHRAARRALRAARPPALRGGRGLRRMPLAAPVL